MLQMSNIEHSGAGETLHYLTMKTKDLTAKQILYVPCPTCGAATGDPCELHSGALRTEPHRDRKLSAAEAVETIQQTTTALKPWPKARVNIPSSSQQF
jgi:hypothetical protein